MQEDPPDDTSDLLQEIMLYYPEAVDTFPLEFSNLHQEQNADATIQDKITKRDYVKTTFGNYELATKTVDDEQRIVVPQSIHYSTINWYHYTLHGRSLPF